MVKTNVLLCIVLSWVTPFEWWRDILLAMSILIATHGFETLVEWGEKR